MRLLLVTQHFRLAGAGAENDAVTLCRALAERGHDVHVSAETGDPMPDISLHLRKQPVNALREHFRPDLVIDWGFYCEADIHRVGGAVHSDFLPYALKSAPRGLRWLKRLGYRKHKHQGQIRHEATILHHSTGLFLAISERVAAQVRGHGVPADRVRVLYNSVDTRRFSPDRRKDLRAAARKKWGVPDEAALILFVANDLRLKNLGLLRQVLKRLCRGGTYAYLAVVGKRPPRFDAPWLIYEPTMPDIEKAYAAADILAHPSYFDSFANVVLEAMSCAVPVLVSDCCGIAELVAQGGGQVLPVHPANAVDQWTDALAGLLRDTDRRRQIGHAGRTVAETHALPAYVDTFEQILTERAETERTRTQAEESTSTP